MTQEQLDKLLSKIKSCIPENPYPESIFPMNEDGYIKAIPDPNLRTAISGFMGRWVYDMAVKTILTAIEDRLSDELE